MAKEHYAFAVPIVPGKLESWKSMVDEIKGPRRKEYKASRKKAGISHEHVWLQHTPQGDMVIVSVVGKDASKMLEKFAASKEPFDVWFLKQTGDLHGINPAAGLPPANESYLDIL
jgi:hypothetical protein